MAEAMVQITHLNKTFENGNDEISILNDINLTINKGEFVTIVGHSGCGKSTLLKIIGGLVGYKEGNVWRNGANVYKPDSDCGIVFQDHRLLPWLTIQDNVALGLQHLSRKERRKVVAEHIELVGLKGFETSYPHQLSGGMSQRAAIARGLVNNPPLLLLDEPFGALDALTRIKMQKEIKRIQKEEQTTMILVTHDIDEAIVLGDKVVVLSARPGEVKAVLEISERGQRRNSEDFNAYKKQIYQYLFEEEEEFAVEYYI